MWWAAGARTDAAVLERLRPGEALDDRVEGSELADHDRADAELLALADELLLERRQRADEDGLLAAGPQARLLVVGGDCTSHAGAMAGIRRARPGARLGIAWFDAHGDVNTPDTTPSGKVWGMPLAMIVGHGAPDLLAAADAPTADAGDAALLGSQVLDETESRVLAASRVAHFGAGMLGTDAGRAALEAWARVVATRVDAFYIAFDMDALDAAGDWALAMPEPNGISLETAVSAVRTIAAAGPVAGFGATAILLGRGGDPERTADAAALLAEAALG